MTRYPRLCDVKYLSEEVLTLHAESLDLHSRAREAGQICDDLAQEDRDTEAATEDGNAAAVAVRAGKPASSVGRPAAEKLEADRTAAAQEFEALHRAAINTDDDLQAAFGVMAGSAKTNGQAAVESAEAKYRKALTVLAETRAEYFRSLSVREFLVAAANGSNRNVQTEALDTARRGVTVNQINASGERVNMLRPMVAEQLLKLTFGLDLPTEGEGA